MSTAMEVRVGTLVNALASCLCDELEQAERESSIPKPCFCGVLPGSVVSFDYCDEGGMAWARLAQITPVMLPGRNCVMEYDVTVELAIMRCAPVIEEDGDLPTMEEQLAAAMLQNFDMGLMHKVITCCEGIPASFTMQEMGAYIPVGPDGACVGGAWTCTWRTA